ncbi:hypothetical protein MAR_026528 [Mya arenaria]|uniref:Uncharacterized protein n=1 Tax=Mya arenaria TaxID=6604 RepID=A0ABY7EQW8_MYAAR|nr:hypothetical protein MAR_026528 [Mya arenaria]
MKESLETAGWSNAKTFAKFYSKEIKEHVSVKFQSAVLSHYKEAAEKKLGIKDDFAKDRDEGDLAKNRGEDDLAENVKKVVEFDPTNLLRMYYNSRKDAFCAVILKDGLYKRRHEETGFVADRPRPGRQRVTSLQQDRHSVLSHRRDRFRTSVQTARETR